MDQVRRSIYLQRRGFLGIATIEIQAALVSAESMASNRNISFADLSNLSLLDDLLAPPAAIIGIRSGKGTSIHERRAIGSARAASKAGIDALGVGADVTLGIVEKRPVPIVVANDLPVASIAN